MIFTNICGLFMKLVKIGQNNRSFMRWPNTFINCRYNG